MSMATIQTLLRTILLDGSPHTVGVLLLPVIQLWENEPEKQKGSVTWKNMFLIPHLKWQPVFGQR